MRAVTDLLPKNQFLTDSNLTSQSYDEYQLKQCDWYNNREGDLKEFDCRECRNKGYVQIMKDGYTALKECKCMTKRRNMRLVEKSGLNELVEKYTLDNYHAANDWQRHIKGKAMAYIANPERWFFVGGQVGAGKTHICTAITSELMKQGKQAYYMLYRDEITRLKKVVMEDEYDAAINRLKKIEVLYIDDLFKTERDKMPTTADINIIFEILNYRYNNNSITLFSSEMRLNEIIDIDEAIGSRIYEYAADHAIQIKRDTNKNMRINKNNTIL